MDSPYHVRTSLTGPPEIVDLLAAATRFLSIDRRQGNALSHPQSLLGRGNPLALSRAAFPPLSHIPIPYRDGEGGPPVPGRGGFETRPALKRMELGLFPFFSPTADRCTTRSFLPPLSAALEYGQYPSRAASSMQVVLPLSAMAPEATPRYWRAGNRKRLRRSLLGRRLVPQTCGRVQRGLPLWPPRCIGEEARNHGASMLAPWFLAYVHPLPAAGLC